MKHEAIEMTLYVEPPEGINDHDAELLFEEILELFEQHTHTSKILGTYELL